MKGGMSLTTIITCVVAVISTASFLVLWFCMVHRELRSKIDTLNSAQSQLAGCRKNHVQTMGSSGEQDAKSILIRSQDIYRQSVMLYNRTLHKPRNRIPALLMGFRQIKEGKNSYYL